jgi:hypothetical protein
MTQMLALAFAEAGKLSSAEHDVLASRVLAKLTDDDEFDRAIAASADKLASLANEALARISHHTAASPRPTSWRGGERAWQGQ